MAKNHSVALYTQTAVGLHLSMFGELCFSSSKYDIRVLSGRRRQRGHVNKERRWLTCTALLRKQLFCPGPFKRPFVLVKATDSLEGAMFARDMYFEVCSSDVTSTRSLLYLTDVP